MRPKILFSPVGMTDPMRNLYDGPLMHIVRHYRPDMVYLFLTAEVEQYDRYDDRYAQSILAIHPDCRIQKIYTGIRDPHNFDRFIGLFSRNIEQITDKFPDGQILLNLTSGTPQMLLALALEAVLSPYDLLALQVTSPDNRSNINSHPIGAEFNLAEQLAYNLDQQDPASPNRCHVLPLSILRQNNARQSILSLISRYEYPGALAQYRANQSVLQPAIGYLLRHACARESMDLREAKRLAEKCPDHLNLFPIQEATPQLLTEYFMIMSIRQKRGQLPDFLLKITPFLFYLTKYYIETRLHFPLKQYTSYQSEKKLLDANKIKAVPELAQYFRDEFGSDFHNSELSFTNLLPILAFIAAGKNHQAKMDTRINSVLQKLRELRAYEKTLRNEVAHTITAISEETFAATAKQLHQKNPDFTPSMTSSRLLEEIKTVMNIVLGPAASRYQFVYDTINREIKELIHA